MKFKRLFIENFMSIIKTDIELDNQGLVLIQGSNIDEDAFDSNGAGKSAIFSEAPCWCLFGETIRGLKADGVVNRQIGKNTQVNLAIEADNGDIFEIIRHRKHKEHKNSVLFFKNSTNITGRSDKETNKMIEDLIQMDYLTFTNSIMFGQGLSKMFASSTDGEQKRILEQILQIDIFKLCQDNAKTGLSELNVKLKDKEDTRTSLESQKNSSQDTIRSLEIKELELKGNVERRIAELIEEQKQYEADLSDLPDVDKLEENKVELLGLINKVESELENYSEFSSFQVQLLGLKESISNEIRRNKSTISKLEKQLTDLQTGKNVPSVCDKCGQPLPLNDTSSIEKHLKDDIKENELELSVKEKELDESLKLLESVNKQLEGKEELEKSKTNLEKSIADLNYEIRHTINSEESIGKAYSQIDLAIQEQEKLLGTTYSGLIQENKDKVADIEKKLLVLDKDKKVIEEEIELYNFWVNAFGNQGIKSILLDSVTPYLNQRANYYLSKLSDSSIEVKFNTQTELKNGDKRDKFSIDVTNENGDDTYGGNSGGEKRRIDISVSMALQDLVQSRSNNSIDLVVYDEAFENLDAIGCQNVIEILQEKAQTCGSVMVITHNDELKQLFNKNIVVEKTSGETKVQYID